MNGDLLKSINQVVLTKLKHEADAFNNTLAWIKEDALFIDSAKGSKVFESLFSVPSVNFEVVHLATKEQWLAAMTGGACETPEVGGRKAIANVYKVTLK
jgi:hypothetical protein